MRIADVSRKDFTFNDALSISKGTKKARVIVLHDSDIMVSPATLCSAGPALRQLLAHIFGCEMDDWVMMRIVQDASEMDDWVMRMVDLTPPTRQLTSMDFPSNSFLEG